MFQNVKLGPFTETVTDDECQEIKEFVDKLVATRLARQEANDPLLILILEYASETSSADNAEETESRIYAKQTREQAERTWGKIKHEVRKLREQSD